MVFEQDERRKGKELALSRRARNFE